MKGIIVFIYFFITVLSFKAQSLSKENIYLTVSNIPKINSKIVYNSRYYKIDKSATLTYNTFNNAKKDTILFDTISRNISTIIDVDTMFLKVRYNPGKYARYILRRGDIAKIEYVFDIPYLTLDNRVLKKHDIDISDKILAFENKEIEFRFSSITQALSKDKKEKDRILQKSLMEYDNVLKTIDSLYKYQLLSKPEFKFYKEYIYYSRQTKANEFEAKEFSKKDLHNFKYQLYLKQFVFKNLKKKIISLGNGMARNSLESFDFTYQYNQFSKENKQFLLESFLKNIKLDFPRRVFLERLEKYNKLYPEQVYIEKEIKKNVLTESELNNVKLMDNLYNSTSLKKVIDSHKGKIVYIDFWTSWCAPCRAAFPSYKKLRERYKNKPVVFIFISGDSDEIKWKVAEEKEQLTNSFLATNFGKSEFYSKLKLRSFPRYLLFNKKGELIADRFVAPDSDNITQFLDEYLLSKK